MASLCSTVSIPSSRSPGRCRPSVAGYVDGGLISQCRFLSRGSTFECRIQQQAIRQPLEQIMAEHGQENTFQQLAMICDNDPPGVRMFTALTLLDFTARLAAGGRFGSCSEA